MKRRHGAGFKERTALARKSIKKNTAKTETVHDQVKKRNRSKQRQNQKEEEEEARRNPRNATDTHHALTKIKKATRSTMTTNRK